jgi:hypothetical protein
VNEELQPLPPEAEPTLPSEATALPRPGKHGCHGVNAQGQPCDARPVWNRDANGVKTGQQLFCYAHSLARRVEGEGRQGWPLLERRDQLRRGLVDPERARELLRICIAVMNEQLTLEGALMRMTPWFGSRADVAMLRPAGAAPTLHRIREERRVEFNTERIVREIETGIVNT